MNKMWLLLLISLNTFCGKDAAGSDNSDALLLNKITLASPAEVKSKVGQTIDLKLDVPAGFTGSFSWTYDNNVFSTDQNTKLKLDKAGSGQIVVTATTASGKTKRLTTFYFAAKDEKYQVLVYQPSWKVYKNQNWEKITHICLCFGSISENGEVDVDDVKSKLSRTISDAHNNGVYVLLSIGGGDANVTKYGFTEALSKESTRNALVNNLVKTVKEMDLDGIDVDYEHWEYGVTPNNNIRSANLELFYRDLRNALPEGYLQTTAIGQSMLRFDYFKESMHQYLDLINLMIYDNTGPWASSAVGPHSDWNFYTTSIADARRAKIPDSKIIPGVPFYGIKFKSTTSPLGAEHVAYSDIVKTYPGAEDMNEIAGAYFYYDGKPIIDKKTNYIVTEKLGGIMVWELTQDSEDASKSLLNVIDNILD